MLPLKLVSSKTGEIRRWPPMETCWAQLEKIAEVLEIDMERMCLTYFDHEGDGIIIAAGNGPLACRELAEAHRCMAQECRKNLLTLVVHKSKHSALRWLAKRKQLNENVQPSALAATMKSEDVELALGPRPGRLVRCHEVRLDNSFLEQVALDLRIPLREAEELVRRARSGDEIARRVVLPSEAYFAFLTASDKTSILVDDTEFEHELNARDVEVPLWSKQVASGKNSKDGLAIHWGVGYCYLRHVSRRRVGGMRREWHVSYHRNSLPS